MDIKQFIKKYELFAIIVITLLLIYIIVFFNQKLNFFLGNELIVHLEPQQKSFSMHYGGSSRINFNVSIENVAYCKASCSYSFTDKSKNEVLEKNDFEIGIGQNVIKSYNLSVKRLGSGQDLYNFEIKCHSVRSFFCHTGSPEKSRSSLILVNYDLTEAEKALKNELKSNFTELLQLLQDVDVAHQKASQKYFELAHKLNLKNMTSGKIEIDYTYDKIRVSIENLRSIWSVENYAQLKQSFNKTYFDDLNYINRTIGAFDKRIDDAAGLHNSILSQLSLIYGSSNELNPFIKILGDKSITGRFNSNLNDFNKLSSSVTNNTFENYDRVVAELNKIELQQNSIIETSRWNSAKTFFESEYLLKSENDLLCNLQQNCSENASIEKAVDKSQSFVDKYPKLTDLSQNCLLLAGISEKHSVIRNETSKIIGDKNITFNADEKFINLTQKFKNNEVAKINNSYYYSLQKLKDENKTNESLIQIAEEFAPDSEINISETDYNKSVNISLYLLSGINLSKQSNDFLIKCSEFENVSNIAQFFDFSQVSANITYNLIQNIDTVLSDNPPICCVFNDCSPCCRDDSCKNDPKTFPVIFLHGHSFYKDNSPEYSLDAFNKLQSKLDEDGYLNAGIVSLYSKNESLQSGIWSLSGRPITAKVSYYYDAFRKDDKYILIPTKSENIDTYAVRLKDLIDIVKERTGKPKVNMIAHSMGGLVARRYIQIFDASDVNKFIMIATPNHGISSKAASYCGYLGENRECQDMLQGSLFINKLNDPSKQPSGVKMYDIIGTGCNTDSGNGDGVVTAENAKLDNTIIFYINGTCNGVFGGTLHTDLLNLNLYPETYRIVKEIMNE